jgi:hypothetical protein
MPLLLWQTCNKYSPKYITAGAHVYFEESSMGEVG